MSEKHEIAIRERSVSRSPTPRKSVTPVNGAQKGKGESQFNLYFELIAKIIFLVIAIYLIFLVFNSISNDVLLEIKNQNEQYLSYIEESKKAYEDNQCKYHKFEALEAECKRLETIINKPPPEIGKSKVAVRYFATLINELINPLSPKTVILFVLIIVLIVWIPKFFL
ncbi:hypothetical protein M9Y10_039466 [Tritrichomonas musculus]|uniref:Brl1/Brr6 domain-containing protein n=1 Tax=Tritrichomonas musculus TaxID=1915356 RepID=A0ABR2KCD6_9EUKA